MTDWRFAFTARPSLPALAWVAVVRRGQVRVDHGTSVRVEGGAFFEGTWAGYPFLSALPGAPTVFGSGMVAGGGELRIIAPSHHLEGIYHAPCADALVVSNSLVGLLVATGLDLDPEFDYPSLFLASTRLCWLIEERDAEGLRLLGGSFEIPTRTAAVTAQFVENVLIRPDLTTVESRKPREAPFDSFADYRSRLAAATTSIFANGKPYEPIVALSSGYDSTAVAALAAQAGCRRSVGFATARRSPRDGRDHDSGAVVAGLLGLDHVEAVRLAYLRATDLPEAEFLSTGMAGEDIMFRAFGPELAQSILLTGYWAGTEWAMPQRHAWRHVSPTTTAGADLGEFRLRANFFHVPLPVFGAARPLDAPSLLDRAEMAPYRLGGVYDRPIPRRLAEEAGVPRGTFGVAKRAANVLLPRDGLGAFTPAARDSIQRFAAAEGRHITRRRRRPFSRLERAVAAGARRLRLAPVVDRLERRRSSLVHFEPGLGTLLLRWAIDVVRERYEAVERVY